VEKTKVTHLDEWFEFLRFRVQRSLGGKGVVTKATIPGKTMERHRTLREGSRQEKSPGLPPAASGSPLRLARAPWGVTTARRGCQQSWHPWRLRFLRRKGHRHRGHPIVDLRGLVVRIEHREGRPAAEDVSGVR
jgi:hypothetical protein